MVISIPPITIAIVIIIIGNSIISFGKSKILNLCSIIFSSALSVVGIVGMIVIRFRFLESLNRNARIQSFSPEFSSWAIEKFDSYAIVSITITCVVVIAFLIGLLFHKKIKIKFLWTYTSVIIISIMIINFIACSWYGLSTINKLFDISRYLSELSTYEFFVLHIPLVVKKTLIIKRNKKA